MADLWEQAAKQYKPDPHAAPAASGNEDWKLWAQPQASAPSDESALSRGAGAFLENINPLPGLRQAVLHPIDTAKGLVNAQVDQFRKAGADLQNTREMPNLSDRLMSAGGHALAGAIPLVGPAAAQAGEEIGEGKTAEGVGHGLGLIGSVSASPRVVRGLGKAAGAAGESLAETAMGVGKRDRLYDANPGRGILRDTSGVTPESAVRSGEKKLSGLNSQLEAAANAASGPADLTPARNVIHQRMGKALAANAGNTAEQLQPMANFLEKPGPGFAGATNQGSISAQQTPSQALAMRREFTPNFKIVYGPQVDNTTQGVGKQVYHALSDEVKRTVPEAQELDPRMHDLSAAIRPAESVTRNPGLMQRIQSRIGARTGALVGAVAGYHAGGIPGAVAGLVLPELAADPVAQMIGGRSLHYAGKSLSYPVAPNAARIAPLVKPKQQEQGR